MPSKKIKVTGKKVLMTKSKGKPKPSSLSGLQLLQTKFKKLSDLRTKLTSLKVLYAQHDALMAELLPLFIEQDTDKFVVRREIALGAKKYRLTPHFYDEKKGVIVPKVWKSTAFPSATIE